MDNLELRKSLKAKRCNLSCSFQHTVSLQIAHLLNRSLLFKRSQRVAFYLPIQGEADPTPLLHLALSLNKICYLPVLHPFHQSRLWFMPYSSTTTLVYNRFGILEPVIKYQQLIPAWSLDLILMPLVAFDLTGNRLGMGGGYYDRTLANIIKHPLRPKPILIGLAYEFQKVAKLTQASWDVALDYVVTEQRLYAMKDNNYNVP